MAAKPIEALRGKHEGFDIFVLASGASAGYIDKQFFDNKIVIGVNEVWLRFSNLDYLVRKEAARAEAAYQSGIPLIISKHNCGALGSSLNSFSGDYDYYIFNHRQNQLTEIDLSVIGSEYISAQETEIIVSYSTITSAMHLAAYMGAANIILVGHDCGKIDGLLRMAGLPEALAGDDFYEEWLKQIEPQSIMVREALEEFYDVRIYSLNPFLNFGLEGHRYER